mmetsp:Transcript_51111/g.128237  ORF Transcript_51111/g.128237 Transcript_51111/m.128237 type:complete len:455 (+) Transcript_51111:354-1718(+)
MQARTNERPGTHVGVLLLHPAQLPGVREARKLIAQGGVRERRQLLETYHGDTCARLGLHLAQLLGQVVVDATRAAHHQLHELRIERAGSRIRLEAGIGQHRLEASAGRELLERRDNVRVAQQRLRADDDGRLAVLATELATQRMKVAGGCARPHHVHVGVVGHLAHGRLVVRIVAQLQEALDAAGGVLRPGTVHAVRQEERERRLAAPLLVAGGQELIDHHLRGVHKIAELRLPQAEALRRFEAHAVLVAEHRQLAERAVHDVEAARRTTQLLLERGRLRGELQVGRAERVVTFAGLLVGHTQVPVAEGAAHSVLAAEAHGASVGQQRAERHRLGSGPVECALGRIGVDTTQARLAVVAQQALMHREAVRCGDTGACHRAQQVQVDAGLRLQLAGAAAGLELCARAGGGVGHPGPVAVTQTEAGDARGAAQRLVEALTLLLAGDGRLLGGEEAA